MNISDIKNTYINSGFTWTPHLEELMQMYAGKKFFHPHHHPLVKEDVETSFYDPSTVHVGTDTRDIYLTSKELGEEVAHVGWSNNSNVDLLLSVSGRLVGFVEDMLFSWSDDPAPNWRPSIEQILLGVGAKKIADLEMDDDADSEAITKEYNEKMNQK
jgi:hypothetical protein